MIRRTIYATAAVTVGLVVGGGAYAVAGVSAAPAAERPAARPVAATAPAADDHGGRVDRDRRTEPGDDHRANADRGRGGDDRGSDHRGGDDHGSDGHGSDD